MALDGLFLSKLKDELNTALADSRVEKVYQPAREELVFVMRRRGGQCKLFISARADCPRIHIINRSIENPTKPPMLCMLFRKCLGGARFMGAKQIGLDRVLHLNFLTKNELGDEVVYTLAVEIMGKYSNVILIGENGRVVDSLKRVNENKSSVREILPGVVYELPARQDKLNILTDSLSDIYDRVMSFKNMRLSSALLSSLEGVSKLLCNELIFEYIGDDPYVSELSDTQKLISALALFKKNFECGSTEPVVLYDANKPKEIYFFNLMQYGDVLSKRFFPSLSQALEEFYYERDRVFRTRQRAQQLTKVISNSIERISRKISLQTIELENTADAQKYKIYGELIAANAYALSKGMSNYEVLNYYDNSVVSIKVNSALTPSENSQVYYKKYKKSLTAKVKLKEELERAGKELEYLKSVEDLLSRSTTFEEMSAIKAELISQGFIKKQNKGESVKVKKLPPFEYRTTNGFTVLVGRNNSSNDTLTLTTAAKNDLWFHTKLIHGSHTVLVTQGREVDDLSIMEAAGICAFHSKGRMSSGVPVDYTAVKNVRKPNGAKPGMVIYEHYNTVYVTPNSEMVEELKVKD